MGLETATYISDLVPTNPVGTDAKAQGDDHLRLIKAALQTSFPNLDAPMTATGKGVLVAGDAIAARLALGASPVGDAVFSSGSAAGARGSLGAGAIGGAVFTAATNIAAEDAMGVARSIAQNGYRKTGDGLIIQWGTTVATTNASSITSIAFPGTFPTNAYTVLVSNGDPAATLSHPISSGLSGTGCSVTWTNGTTGIGAGVGTRVNWIAFGN